jgi:hypothetical protein
MNKSKVLVLVMALFMPMFASVVKADIRQYIDRLELGVTGGVAFYVGQENPVLNSNLMRVQTYDVLGFAGKEDWGWPGVETFGGMVGYRFDTYWHIKAQATRQRVCYAEYADPQVDMKNVYYNAMWHVDVMAEYNLLSLGNIMMPKQGLYSVVPYVGFGLGVTMFNEQATLRATQKHPDQHTYDKHGPMFPRVGSMPTGWDSETKKVTGWESTKVGVGAYIPVAFGVKWRVSDNIQLKGTFQYDFYLTPNSNLEGGSSNAVAFKDLNRKFAANHNNMFSLTAIFNFGKWYEDRLITY